MKKEIKNLVEKCAKRWAMLDKEENCIMKKWSTDLQEHFTMSDEFLEIKKLVSSTEDADEIFNECEELFVQLYFENLNGVD